MKTQYASKDEWAAHNAMVKEAESRKAAKEPAAEKIKRMARLVKAGSAPNLGKINGLLSEATKSGLVGKWAFAGGIAVNIHGAPISTDDVDVLVVLPQSGALIDLHGLYDLFLTNGATAVGEWIAIDGWKTQFVPATSLIEREALRDTVIVDGLPVVAVEPLIAMKVAVGRAKDILHVRHLFESVPQKIDRTRLDQLLNSYGLTEKFEKIGIGNS